jgi:hypothetical protein
LDLNTSARKTIQETITPWRHLRDFRRRRFPLARNPERRPRHVAIWPSFVICWHPFSAELYLLGDLPRPFLECARVLIREQTFNNPTCPHWPAIFWPGYTGRGERVRHERNPSERLPRACLRNTPGLPTIHARSAHLNLVAVTLRVQRTIADSHPDP